VTSINIDSEKGTITIVGDIDPTKLMKKFEKMGKTAELWSFERSPSQEKSNSYNKKKVQFACDDDDDDEDDDDEYISKRNSASHTTMNGNRHGRGLFGKRANSVPPSSRTRFYPRTPRRAFPRTPQPAFRFPWTIPNPIWSRGSWDFFRRPSPSMLPPPPPPPVYGYGYGYESRLQRLTKPIIHYTSYWDNYRRSP
jgi:hypothetical protein